MLKLRSVQCNILFCIFSPETENGGGEEEDQDDIDDVELEEEEEGKKVTHEMIAKWKTGLEVRMIVYHCYCCDIS